MAAQRTTDDNGLRRGERTHAPFSHSDGNRGHLSGTAESRLSRRPSLRFSPTGLDLGLMLEELQQFAAGLQAAATPEPAQGAASMLVRFSTFALMVCRLRADGGGRSPRSLTQDVTFVSDQKQI